MANLLVAKPQFEELETSPIPQRTRQPPAAHQPTAQNVTDGAWRAREKSFLPNLSATSLVERGGDAVGRRFMAGSGKSWH
jgi:hypothetical protein